MLVPVILAEIMQHAKLALHTEIISVCVYLDLDLKAMIVIEVRNKVADYNIPKNLPKQTNENTIKPQNTR